MRGSTGLSPIALAMVLLGCQSTTGDPRAGGLFGWSEEKALQRQAELKAQAAAATQAASEERLTSARLQDQWLSADAETESLLARFNALTEENQVLEDRLAELRKVNVSSSGRLQAILAELDALRSQRSAPPSRQPQRPKDIRTQVEQMDLHNEKLHRAILLLLQR